MPDPHPTFGSFPTARPSERVYLESGFPRSPPLKRKRRAPSADAQRPEQAENAAVRASLPAVSRRKARFSSRKDVQIDISGRNVIGSPVYRRALGMPSWDEHN